MKIHELFATMAKHNASDLHLKVGEPPIFRISGELVRMKSAVLTETDAESLLMPLANERSRADLEHRGYCDFSYFVEGVGRFRINVFKQTSRLSAAVRLVKPRIPSYEELQLPPLVGKCATYEQGLVLIGGITGSGKSTTIAAILNDINAHRRCHIITIEDPIEYVFTDDKALINQREIGLDVLNFQEALRSSVREDPDVMLLGEMRDAETFETALTAAETGHLVFGTIHSSSAAATIGRILDLFPPSKHEQIRTSLGFNLRCVINQKRRAPAAAGGRDHVYHADHPQNDPRGRGPEGRRCPEQGHRQRQRELQPRLGAPLPRKEGDHGGRPGRSAQRRGAAHGDAWHLDLGRWHHLTVGGAGLR